MARTRFNRSWTEESHERLEMLYSVMGMDIGDIASDLDKTPTAVQTQINILGLRLTPQAVQARRERGLRSKRWTTPINREYPNKKPPRDWRVA